MTRRFRCDVVGKISTVEAIFKKVMTVKGKGADRRPHDDADAPEVVFRIFDALIDTMKAERDCSWTMEDVVTTFQANVEYEYQQGGLGFMAMEMNAEEAQRKAAKASLDALAEEKEKQASKRVRKGPNRFGHEG